MRIIEQTVVGKHSPGTCEDGIAVTPDFVAVVDGSTSKTPVRLDPSLSNGRLCTETVVRYINTLSGYETIEEFCQGITRHIAEWYRHHRVDTDRLLAHPWERPTASAIVYSRLRNEIWMVGDCQCIVDGTLHTNEKPGEKEAAQLRADYLRQFIHQGLYTVDQLQQHDYGREKIHHLLTEATRRQNIDFAVIDGFPIAMRHVRVIPSGHEMVLASDGYPHLRPTLAESERLLAHQLATDPLCIYHCIATKGLTQGYQSFDDRAYIRFAQE